MTLITAALVFLAIVRSNAFEFWDPAVDFPQLNTYFNNDFIGDSFSRLQQTYPDLVRTSSLGKTPGDNDINEITITSNVSNWETANKPSVKYVANMHGNEIRGRGLLLKLAHYLVIKYKDDKDVKELVDTTVFHLLPTINPDGFDGAAQSCSSVTGRYTSDGTDMNRDFPSHWFEGKRLKFAEETKMVMSYADQVPAVLGISFHDGALVANYPWDGKPDLPSGKYAASPDDSVFINLAKTYSLNHKNMYKTSAQCGHDAFQDGITNGNKWYKVFNGMQDWNYYYHDCFELTVELGCCKYPEDAASTFGDVWSDNFNSVLAYTKLTNYGIKGQVTNFKGNPITGVTITVSGVNKTIKVRHQQGYYWRPLLAGTYNVSASKKGYYTLHRRNVVVREGESTDVSFILISKSQRNFHDEAGKDRKEDEDNSSSEDEKSDADSRNNSENQSDSETADDGQSVDDSESLDTNKNYGGAGDDDRDDESMVVPVEDDDDVQGNDENKENPEKEYQDEGAEEDDPGEDDNTGTEEEEQDNGPLNYSGHAQSSTFRLLSILSVVSVFC